MREREKRETFVGDGGAEEGGHAVANAFDLVHFEVRRGDGVLEGEREKQNGYGVHVGNRAVAGRNQNEGMAKDLASLGVKIGKRARTFSFRVRVKKQFGLV